MPRPEDRYDNLTTTTLPDGRTVYKPARPSVVTIDETTDQSIVATEQDRMDIIAHNVYGTPLNCWKIAAGNAIVNGSLHVKPGTKLYIPKQ